MSAAEQVPVEVSVTQARAALAELVNRVRYGGERMVMTRHGRPLAALVSAEDLARLQRLDALEAEARAQPQAQASAAEEPIARALSDLRSPPAPRRPAPGRFGIAAEHRGPHSEG